MGIADLFRVNKIKTSSTTAKTVGFYGQDASVNDPGFKFNKPRQVNVSYRSPSTVEFFDPDYDLPTISISTFRGGNCSFFSSLTSFGMSSKYAVSQVQTGFSHPEIMLSYLSIVPLFWTVAIIFLDSLSTVNTISFP